MEKDGVRRPFPLENYVRYKLNIKDDYSSFFNSSSSAWSLAIRFVGKEYLLRVILNQ